MLAASKTDQRIIQLLDKAESDFMQTYVLTLMKHGEIIEMRMAQSVTQFRAQIVPSKARS